MRVLLFVLTLSVVGATPLAAQRGEIAVLGGFVQSPDEEFDRVFSTEFGPPTYTRQRGSRVPGTAFGVAATFAIRGHWFAELGAMHHGVDREISSTGLGDPDGPFISTSTHEGSITTLWMGPSYRFVDRERIAISVLAAPALHVMRGDAYTESEVAFNTPTRATQFGFLLGLRARYWATERFGIQLSVEDAFWRVPVGPHPTDGTPMYPETYLSTPTQHDVRVHLGVALKLF